LSGLWVEKSETTNKTGDLNSLSDAELAAVILGDKSHAVPLDPEDKKLN
jgi:hypothetical protein